MTITFDRPLGTPADLSELEYISAISQTAPKLRQDASIDGALKNAKIWMSALLV